MTNARPENTFKELPRPTPAVSVAVWKDNRILLVKRGKPPNKDLWALPGGKIEPGESHEVAAAREVLEETGLSVDIGSVFRVRSHISTSHHYVLISMNAEFVGGDLKAGDDASDARFVTQTEAAELRCVEDLANAITSSLAVRK